MIPCIVFQRSLCVIPSAYSHLPGMCKGNKSLWLSKLFVTETKRFHSDSHNKFHPQTSNRSKPSKSQSKGTPKCVFDTEQLSIC
jgi:hypothetical protein